MLVKLTEIRQNNTLTSDSDYSLQEVFVNPEHVVMIREEFRMNHLNEQGVIAAGLLTGHKFTKLTINRGHTGTEIVVVGEPNMIESALSQEKQLLKG